MNNGNPIQTSSDKSTALVIVLGLISAIFSANLAIASIALASLSVILFLYGVYRLAKKKMIFAVILVLAGSSLFIAPLDTVETIIATASVYLCLVGAMALGGYLLGSGKTGAVAYLLLTALAYAASLIVSGSAITALSSLLPVPGAVIIAVCSKKKLPRLSTLCALTVAFLALSYLPEIILLVIEHGAETVTHIGSVINGLRESLVASIEESMSAIPTDERVYSAETVKLIVDLTFDLLPSIMIIIACAVSFITQSCYFALRNTVGTPCERSQRVLEPSPVSAWMFYISFGVMLITAFIKGQAAEVLSVSMMNLNLILLPIFAVVSFTAIAEKFRRFNAKPSIFTILCIALLIFNVGSLLLYPIAGYGAFITIKKSSLQKPEAKKDPDPAETDI